MLARDCTALCALIVVAVVLAPGCVTAFTQCDYVLAENPQGNGKIALLEEATGWSSVLGKGTIDNTVTVCTSLNHQSSGTGLDEGTLRAIEALSKIAPPAAAASALSDVSKALADDEASTLP